MVIALLSWLSYSNQKEMLLKTNLEQVQRLSTQQAGRIGEWLNGKIGIISALDQLVHDENAVKSLQQAEKSGGFSSTYFGKSSGEMVDSDPTIDNTGYDPRTRPWYQQASNTSHAIITTPYIDFTTRNLVITLAQQTNNGVMGGDIYIDDIVDDVNRMKLPSDGFAIMTAQRWHGHRLQRC